ncbi:MAG: UDP-N-acetylmuramate dehydrogenase [Clostridia bacterium]|nr:UDP-N-acetylmuramate dehydrogenase [Clostridia bacterium]
MITDKYSELISYLDKEKIEYLVDEPMSNHTSFRIGGPAKIFVSPRIETFPELLQKISKHGINRFVLGKGSNVLFDDEGFDGAVISTLNLDSVDLNGRVIMCAAGCSLTALSRFALDNSLSGLSFAYGIPGSVGGAVYMNAGAYNGEISYVLSGSDYVDTNTFTVHHLGREEHCFSYRHSSYKDHPERIIISAEFTLKDGDANVIKAEMDDFMERRRTKQPLEYPSAGSVFKRYPGRYTAQMIDEAGLKGASVGGAEVSVKHAGFIINKGGATSGDVKELVALIEKTIKEKFGIEIEREIIYIGKDGKEN